MRYAIIENGVVVNIIVADQDFIDEHYPDAIPLKDTDKVGPNYLFENGEFVEVQPPAPTEIINAEVVEPTKALE